MGRRDQRRALRLKVKHKHLAIDMDVYTMQ